MPDEESGTPMKVEECRRCGEKEVRGLAWWWEGGREFKCDRCGRMMLLGFDETINKQQVENIRGYERANENRSRYFRELEEQFVQKFNKAKENLSSPPDILEHFKPMTDGVKFSAEEEEKSRREIGKGSVDSAEKPFTIPH